MIKVAVVGNREWQNKRKVQQILIELKEIYEKIKKEFDKL